MLDCSGSFERYLSGCARRNRTGRSERVEQPGISLVNRNPHPGNNFPNRVAHRRGFPGWLSRSPGMANCARYDRLAVGWIGYIPERVAPVNPVDQFLANLNAMLD